MELPDRLVRVVPLKNGGLLASDVRGRLHILDSQLNLLRSSAVVPNGLPTYCIAIHEQVAVTRDRIGNVTRWRLDTLAPTATLTADHLRLTAGDYLIDEQPSPTINRGIAIWRDKVYVNNGFVQVAVLDLNTLEVLAIEEPFGMAFMEWICTDRPGQQAVSDKNGRLLMGDLERFEFPISVRVDEESNVHRVLYDELHDRYWATQDSGDSETARVANGIVTVLPDGTIEESLHFASDDVECLAFSSDFRLAFSGGFDAELQVFDNTERALTIVRTISNFSHEIIDLAVLEDDTLAILTQDGQLTHMTSYGDVLDRAMFRNQCIWDIQPLPDVEATYRLATDTGVQTIVLDQTLTGMNPRVVSDWRLGYGFVRSLTCSSSNTFGVGQKGIVFCLDNDGAVVWSERYHSRLHSIALSPDGNRVLVGSNAGAFEHDSRTGEVLAKLELDGHHAWVVGYLNTGDPVVATHNFRVEVFNRLTNTSEWSVKCDGYAKRLRATDHHLYVTGGGGVRQISLKRHAVEKVWASLLENTVENFAWSKGKFYAISYGCQLAVYDEASTEGIGLIEHLPDFPKGFRIVDDVDGVSWMLIGGRGGFLQVRRIMDNGEPVLTRTAVLAP